MSGTFGLGSGVGLVGSYVETFDEAPLPVEIASNAYHRLLTLVASLDLEGDASRRLADINRVAVCELWQ
ncbi:hypothetical protein [Bradyrhizobium hipponense]|uniref:hypothetical protein n=1 Tax=Bradyrhizobium hipponense TaxID=2605638 RepID=UPI001652BE20|nr:hypothetical protein [Bradyrhizobium hipponense]